VKVDDDDDFVKLVDFGIAKVLSQIDSESENLTQPGEVFGSGNYMSPEQCRGQKLDARSDMYSLGAVMYFTLTGRTLFEDSDIMQLLYKHMTQLPDSLQSVREDVPAELESIVLKTLAKDPDDRYQSMDELTLQLEKFEAFNAAASLPPKSADSTVGEQKTLPIVTLSKGGANQKVPIKLKKQLVIALAIAILAVTAGIAIVGWPSLTPEQAVNESTTNKAPLSEQLKKLPTDEVPVILTPGSAQSTKSLPPDRPDSRENQQPGMSPVQASQPKKLPEQKHRQSRKHTNRTGFSRFKSAVKHFFQKLD